MEHHKEIAEYFNRKGVSAIFLFRRNLLRRMVSLLANSYDQYAKLLNGTHKSHVHTPEEVPLSLSLSLSLLYAWSWTHCWLINLGWYTFKVQAFNKLNGVDYSTEGHGGDNSQGFRILQQHSAHHSVLRGSYREPHCKDLFIRSKRSLLHTKPHIIHSCYNF